MSRVQLPVHMTRKERRRIEEKGKRGVCRIQKHCAGNQGYETVASGSVIKHHIDRRWKSKYLIVTACNVFQGDFNVRNYRVDFMKSTSKLKTFQLNDAVVVGGEILHTASGLAVIPLDSHSSVFRHGLFRKKCGILKHYSFEVESFQNANTQDSAFSNELCCHMVADDSTSNLFGVKPHELTRNSTSGQCVLRNCNFNQSTHFPLGAAILRRVRNKWSTTGVLSSCSADGTCRPVWLSQENLSRENLRTGEAFNSAIGSIPVEYSDQSHIPESLQKPAVNSQETADHDPPDLDKERKSEEQQENTKEERKDEEKEEEKEDEEGEEEDKERKQKVKEKRKKDEDEAKDKKEKEDRMTEGQERKVKEEEWKEKEKMKKKEEIERRKKEEEEMKREEEEEMNKEQSDGKQGRRKKDLQAVKNEKLDEQQDTVCVHFSTKKIIYGMQEFKNPDEEKRKEQEMYRAMGKKLMDDIKHVYQNAVSAPPGLGYRLIVEYKVELVSLTFSSLRITVRCSTQEILEHFWIDYCSGHLNYLAETLLVTDEIKAQFDVKAIELNTTILEEEYLACKHFLLETTDAGVNSYCPIPSVNTEAKETETEESLSDQIAAPHTSDETEQTKRNKEGVSATDQAIAAPHTAAEKEQTKRNKKGVSATDPDTSDKTAEQTKSNKNGVQETGGASANQDNKEWNELHSAARVGDVTEIESLLSLGFPVDSRDATNQTPLMIAALNGELQAVKCLLGKGASPSLENNNGWNSLHWASQRGNTDIIELLLLTHGPDIDSTSAEGLTPLMIAALYGKLQAVTFLIGKGASPSLEDNNGRNSLHFASFDGNTVIIDTLLSYGVDIESKTQFGQTPLMIARLHGHTEAVTYLLSRGAKSDKRKKQKSSS